MPKIAAVLTLLAIVATILDWLQTVSIARDPRHYYELNPILGRHPSERRINIYFSICCSTFLALVLTLGMYGEFGWTAGISSALLGIELCCVVNNWCLGIGFGRSD
jgi:hypothetical protein